MSKMFITDSSIALFILDSNKYMMDEIQNLRISLIVVSISALMFTLLVSFSLISYVFITVALYTFYLVASLIPYLLIIILSFMGFMRLLRSDKKFMIGLIGCSIDGLSYLINFISILIMRGSFTIEISKGYTVFSSLSLYSLSLPLYTLISIIMGIIGFVLIIISMSVKFSSPKLRLGSIITILGFILLIFPILGGIMITIGSFFISLGLGEQIS